MILLDQPLQTTFLHAHLPLVDHVRQRGGCRPSSWPVQRSDGLDPVFLLLNCRTTTESADSTILRIEGNGLDMNMKRRGGGSRLVAEVRPLRATRLC